MLIVSGPVLNPRSAKKREQILEAAGELFAEQGYAISMDAIAVRAKVSKQTVYAHFKTKDDLFDTCIRAKCTANQLDGSLIDDSSTMREVLCEFAWRFQNMLMSDEAQHTYKTSVSQADTHPELAQVYLNAGPKTTTDMVAEYLGHNVEKGVIAIDINLRDAALQLLLMLHGKAVYWKYLGQDSGESDEERRVYLDRCVDLFLKGYDCQELASSS
ncbi:TetR/AcrR family transcriptional regulator [Photobacterium alginatilyticum]|uniref:TetR/AcrR family transcriptional regulator n=1 Tax=Photobacterium alginatilyticum TaxID=1775171 RepID=A0ABW9YJ39_9GAMM|nr:TetR/AcrR family transcriptional regulator [Photobacterium alginatilyticum]NBI53238.1 TetR/AcrR family transcriptional regulator [Photobacterium alginatilyticum]